MALSLDTTTHAPGPGAIGTDAHGNTVAAPPAAIERYDLAVDRLLRFDPAALEHAEVLRAEHPDVAITHVLTAHLCLSSTDVVDLAGARSALDALRHLPRTSRERAHTEVIELWAAGNWSGASRRLDELLVRWPSDVLALWIGHQLDFFLGDRVNLRDRIGRSLAALDGHEHQPFLLGMHAFGLEEVGTYDQALRAGQAALDAHPEDVWALHAVAHVHEMRGDVDDGLRAMAEQARHWGEGNLFAVHLWWHHALYLLEADRHDEVLAVYDTRIHRDGADAVPIELLDASAMLWRLRLAGIDSGDRFERLAAAWAGREVAGEPWYVFNDVHDVMARLGAGRLREARELVDGIAASVTSGPGPDNRVMTAEVGLPVARALVASAEGRWDDVVADLVPIRAALHRFGGSHAQRDLFQQTLIDAAVNAGRLPLADALLRERLSLRPSSTFGWDRVARVARARDDQASAAAAAGERRTHATRFAAVAADVARPGGDVDR